MGAGTSSGGTTGRSSTASSAGCGRAPRRGCADASLYRRFRTLGLADVQIGPRLAVDRPEAELRDWWVFAEASALAVLDAAEAEGSYLWAEAYHCAVGMNP